MSCAIRKNIWFNQHYRSQILPAYSKCKKLNKNYPSNKDLSNNKRGLHDRKEVCYGGRGAQRGGLEGRRKPERPRRPPKTTSTATSPEVRGRRRESSCNTPQLQLQYYIRLHLGGEKRTGNDAYRQQLILSFSISDRNTILQDSRWFLTAFFFSFESPQARFFRSALASRDGDVFGFFGVSVGPNGIRIPSGYLTEQN